MSNSAIVGLLRALLVADSAEFETAMKRAADSMKAWEKDLKAVGRQATAVGETLTKSITLPLVALGAGAIKLATDFESSFAGVRKTVDASEAEFKQLEGQFRDLAKQIPIDVNELNKLGEAAGALGIPKAQIADFAKVMAELGVTTNLTSDEAANAIARIQNIFGAAGKDTDRFASTLVALGNAGASTEKEIVEMAQRIAGAGHTVGLTQQQVLAFASTLASVGINAEAGGSAISRVFLKINQAVGTGGAELAKFAKVVDLSAGEFKRAFETDAAGAVQTLIGAIGTLGTKAAPVIQDLFGKNIILTDTILRVAGAGKLLTEQLGLANTAWQDNTALTTEAQKRYETTAAQLTLLWNRIKDVGISLGQALLPAFKSLVAAAEGFVPILEGLVKWFADLPTPIQTAAIALAALAAVAGPALILFGQMALGLSTLAGAFKVGGIAATAFGGVLTFLAAHPIVLLIAGLAALGIGIYAVATAESDLEKQFRESRDTLNQHTAELDIALATYDELKDKQALTRDETQQLDDATRLLAEASGLSEEAFTRQARESDAVTDAIRAQIAAVGDLNAEALRQAAAKKKSLEDQIAALEARRTAVIGGRATQTVPTFVGEGTVMAELPMNAAERLAETKALTAEIHKLTESWKQARDAEADLSGETARYNTIQREGNEALAWLAKTYPGVTAATRAHAGATDEHAKSTKAAKTEAEKYAESLAKIGRAISVGGVLDAMQEMRDQLREAAKHGGLAGDAMVRFTKQIDEWIAAGYFVGPMLMQFRVENVKLSDSLVPTNTILKAVIENTENLAPAMRESGDEVVELTKIYDEFHKKLTGISTIDFSKLGEQVDLTKLFVPPPTALQKFKATMTDFVKDFAPHLGNLLADGILTGDWATVGKRIARDLATGVASMIPVIGPMFAPIVGATVDSFFQPPRGTAFKQWMEAQGGLGALEAQLGTLGAEGARLRERLLKAQRGSWQEPVPQRLIDDITAAFARQAARLEQVQTNLGRLQTAVHVFGGVAPAALRPSIQALLEMDGLTADMRAQLEGLAAAPAWQTMQSQAEALGIDLAALGPAFHEAKLTETALGYARTLQGLADIGSDMGRVLVGMQDELSALYQDAVRHGVALPDTLRPYMQTLIEMGGLVDENGEKVEDLNAVAFKEIEDEALTAVVDILEEIRDLLAHGLPDAARTGAEGVADEFRRHPVIVPYSFQQRGGIELPEGPDAPRPELGLQGGTHGQYVDWGRGTAVTLHGKERVVPAGELGAAAGRPIQITVVSQLDGREVARNQIKYIPRELSLAGV